MKLEIDLWVWDLDRQAVKNPQTLLNAQEQERAAMFVKALHKSRFEQGRARLRLILGQCLGTDPATLKFSYGPKGKPFLPGQLEFNLSHSENWAALAVTSAQVGLDIQKYRDVEPEVAHRFFSAQENQELRSLPSQNWADGFYRCWTRKEAIVKGMGEGLSFGLDGFDVTLTPGADTRITRFSEQPEILQTWSLHHLDFAPDLVGAIAVNNSGRLVEITFQENPFAAA